MTESFVHHGPDGMGCDHVEIPDGEVGLGHTRLAMLGLSFRGHQPMSFDNFTMVYNGEAHNSAEIRFELSTYGYSLNSNSDREVI